MATHVVDTVGADWLSESLCPDHRVRLASLAHVVWERRADRFVPIRIVQNRYLSCVITLGADLFEGLTGQVLRL